MTSVNSDPSTLPAGFTLQNYKITGLLGRGGFGITYLADDSVLEKTVAIKEYFPNDIAYRNNDSTVQPIADSFAKDYKQGLQRFIQEARTVSRFEHLNFARVYSFFELNNTGYMVMRYEKGMNLKKIRNSRQLSENELSTILMQIMDALENLHQENFIHRDIKPDNIIIRENNSPVLIDFGSARNAHGQTERNLTCLVSPGYAPIEQYTSNSKSDKQGPWTDIYSLSATMYFAISGIPPSPAINRGESILHTDRDTFVPVELIAKDQYSRNFLQVIDKGLIFKHKERPQSIPEWRTMFNRGEPSGSRQLSKSSGNQENVITMPADEYPIRTPDKPQRNNRLGTSDRIKAALIPLCLALILPVTDDIGEMLSVQITRITDQFGNSGSSNSLISNDKISMAHDMIMHKSRLFKNNITDFTGTGSEDYHDNENFNEALNTLLPLAEQGQAFAQYNLGTIFFIRDKNESLKWYKLAAEQGYVLAQKQLGFIYDNGIYVDEDNSIALFWYQKAAEQGNAEAQFMLGTMYLHGDGVEVNKDEAEKWLNKAGQKGFENAKETIRQLNQQLSLGQKS